MPLNRHTVVGLNRLEELGATVVARHQDHTVMADPEGCEFCVEPGPAQR